MQASDHAYDNTDAEYREICDFLDKLAACDPFAMWESGRTDFWRYNVHAGKDPRDCFFRDNVHIWRSSEQEIVGLCISEYGKDDLFVEVLPSHRAIYPDVFRWIETTWAASRDAVEIDVFSDDREKIRRLEANGFAFARHFEKRRTYELARTEVAYVLEEGFTIRTFAEHPDMDGRVALVQSAFDNPSYSEANVNGLTGSPDYVAAYDLMVVSPRGQPVAYCVGWRERAREACGTIEPVGTHAAFRRRGSRPPSFASASRG